MSQHSKGFTLIELLIAVFIIGTAVTGLFGLFVLNLKLSQEAEQRVVAVALADERAETIRNLPYLSIGTVGGIPAGSIPQQENVVRNGVTYVVRTDIRYVDDSFDGTTSSNPPDLLNTDYKQARIEVSWTSRYTINPVVLLLTVAPAGIEGGEEAGTLVFNAIDALSAGVAGAAVTLQNSSTNPVVTITTQTDNSGQLVLPGLPVNNNYKLTVTKDGYTSEQTYDPTANFTPDVDHAHLSAIAGQITAKTFSIDRVSNVTIDMREQTFAGAPVANVPYTFRGTKTIGVDELAQPVYVVNTQVQTGANGQFVHQNLVWDSYNINLTGSPPAYDIKETTFPLPYTLNPNTTVTLQVALVPHVPLSLHVNVLTPSGQAIEGASVRLRGPSYDVTQVTGVPGQVYFPEAGGDEITNPNGNYQLEITKTGYQDFDQNQITIDGTNNFTAVLTPES